MGKLMGIFLQKRNPLRGRQGFLAILVQA